METKIITHDTLCVEVGELRFGDERRFHVMGAKLAQFSPLKDLKKGETPDGYATMLESDMVEYVRAVAQVRNHSGFALPVVTDSPEEIHAAFEALDQMPARFVNGWFEAAKALRSAVDPDLAPADELSDSQKKVKTSDSDA